MEETMGMPKPLTELLIDLSLDTTAEAEGIACLDLRGRIQRNLRLMNRKAELINDARLVARGIEDTGFVSEWSRRRLRAMERAGQLEDLERRPLPMGHPVD
jgi:uncharacterized protein (UPF0335 family)